MVQAKSKTLLFMLFLSVFTGVAQSSLAQLDRTAIAQPLPATPLSAAKNGQPFRFEYELKASAWAFILPISGRASFKADISSDTYAIATYVRTTGIADLLVSYDLNVSATGYTHENRLDTYAYVSQNKDGKKNRRVELVYGKDDVAMKVTPRFGNLGDPPAAPFQKLISKDPVTAFINFMLEPRDPKNNNPCGGPIRIFDGRQLTYLHLTFTRLTPVKSIAWSGEALECYVTMDKVAGYDTGEAKADNLTGIDGPIRMYLARLPNGATPIVKMIADSEQIGRVTLQASRLNFVPIPSQ